MTTISSKQRPGVCPSCEGHGVLGDPCPDRVCAKQGVAFIPETEAGQFLAAPASKRDSLVGHFIGQFLIIGLLGKGGFGKVMLGLQRPLYRLKAAIKLLEAGADLEARAGARLLEKFETEASALAVLQHPNIVRLLEFGSFQRAPYIAMEFVPGSRTLQTEINRVVRRGTSLTTDTVQHVLVQILNGLQAAHDQAIIHRDIKPENIMLQAVVGDEWHVKLVDFGLAKVVSESRDTSLVLGTVFYMAPEQVEAKNIGPWTDLYAVAAIAFELMTGHRAFTGKDSQEILRQKLNPGFDHFAALHDVEFPSVVVDFLRKGLARYPQDRFQCSAEMRAALDDVFRGGTASMQFSQDLSHLLDSSARARLESEEVRLREEREALDAERQKLDAERRRIANERVRLASERLGDPIDVEYASHGKTRAITAGRLHALQTGAEPTIAPFVPPTRRLGLLVGFVLGAALAAGITVFVVAGSSNEPPLQPAVQEPVVNPTSGAPILPAAPSPAPPVAPTPDASALEPTPSSPNQNPNTDTTSELPPRVAQPASTKVTFTSTPAGARVFRKDESGLVEVCPETPCTLSLDPTPAPVAWTATLPGYASSSQDSAIAPPPAQVIDFALSALKPANKPTRPSRPNVIAPPPERSKPEPEFALPP